jgi:hypothetical protein
VVFQANAETIAMCSPFKLIVAERVTFPLLFRRTEVMNRHAQAKRRKGNGTNMNSETTNTAAPVAEQGVAVAPEKAPSKKGANQKKAATNGQKAAKRGKPKASPRKTKAGKRAAKPARVREASKPRAESKGARILALIGRSKGATLAEIQKATDWQAHSVRGFLSTAAKKQGLKIESSKNEAGERSYSIAK